MNQIEDEMYFEIKQNVFRVIDDTDDRTRGQVLGGLPNISRPL